MRGKPSPKRDIEGDAKYNDQGIAKFINYVMERGKKSVAEKIVYGALDIIKEKTKQDPRHIFNKAIRRVSPLVEVRGKRVGGANYQVPFQVRGERRYFLACNWIIKAAQDRKGRGTAEKLSYEILEASNGEGNAVKKRESVHKMAEANKAFAHFSRSRRR
ncbi:30S ribosomal protein S7 [Candidatus Falkowbacteria bacterium]|uniref:Small ribosomal subunit protein uS7 n=1 Tax=Candidatus Falkowbacteria bacterium CG10_big_fil_rev_8_21_14_0_10_37_18 TaxID=1974562 RepID=A0A2H0V8V0_9BACT|nr:30S ribosomal protein S7 [Candidatus Falkowbacteria bacterium]NCQ12551.1 30S ribosomal protein S7 [Candidatus Falkowbacteria bacterium]OIO06014.1 MAG: 30S ribosomal protein S7 [Candidatus Falkowbacteria bacterium CG1_02_37_21]PIR95537.1 MAG: 30S ribosomal protein S7 [Candidatus Falkowbacteria bacterium CG10_big_fil_rev_8_21_14_0_10_37_18]